MIKVAAKLYDRLFFLKKSKFLLNFWTFFLQKGPLSQDMITVDPFYIYSQRED